MSHHHATKGSSSSWLPPTNFAMVASGVYRCAYPSEANVPYLRHKGIKTLALLSIEALPAPVKLTLADIRNGDTASRRPIRVIKIASLRAWQMDSLNCGDDFSQQDVQRALDIAVDAQWHPVLFACPTGELQTSVVVGCMRRYQRWSLAAVYGECALFTSVLRGVRPSVMAFIDAWNPEDYPMSETDIVYRNQERQLRERNESALQRRKRNQGKEKAGAVRSAASDKPLPLSSTTSGVGRRSAGVSATSRYHLDEEDSDAGSNEDSGLLSPERPAHGTESTAISSGVMTPARQGGVEEDTYTMAQSPLLSSSGQRPPAAMRRSTAAAAGNKSSDGASGTAGGTGGIHFAEWYLHALASYDADVTRQQAAARRVHNSGHEELPPHEKYCGVRNPPALDARSTFTKESIVEEDDD